jgi:hypothetical protein
MDFFRYWIIRNQRTPFTVQTLLFFSLFVGITRGMLEHLFFGIETNGSDILGFIPFYFSLPFVYATFIGLVPGIRYEQALQSVTFATLLGILPPVIDFLLGGIATHSVFYGYFMSHDYANFPWFGYAPVRNYPLGEAVTIWLTFVLAIAFIYAKTKSFLYAACGILIGYCAFLVYSLALPGLTSFFLFGYVENHVFLERQSPAQLRPALFLLSAVQVLTAWVIDACHSGLLLRYGRRLLHFLPFLSLTLLGAVLSHAESRSLSIAVLITLCSGIAVIAQNDFLTSAKTDATHQRAVNLANATAVIVYAMVLFSGYKLALLGVACFSLSVLYHYDFFNIRSTLLGSMKVEGLWAFFTFLTGVFAGYLKHPNTKTIAIGALAFGGFSLFSIFKDAKDRKADFREGRRTIYTYFLRKKIKVRRFHSLSACFTGVLLAALGITYYSLVGPALWIHLILSASLLLAIFRIHRNVYFQGFMALVCGLIVNLLIYEGGGYGAFS